MSTSNRLASSVCAAAFTAVVFLAAAPSHAANGVPNYDHVVVVMEENHDYNQVIGDPNQPFINSLAHGGALFTQSYGVEHPSQPNYLDIFSGSDQGDYDDNTLPAPPHFTTDNLGAELLHNGKTFAGYSEDLPAVGSNVANAPGAPNFNPKDYARKHNPWVNWQSDAVNASNSATSNLLPSSVNQPLGPFTSIGDYANLPNVAFVVPNQENDGHGVSGPGALADPALLAQGDTWLQNNIGSYATWAKTHNSLLIVQWDENDYTSGNHIATIFYGADVKPGLYPENGLQTEFSDINADGFPTGAPVFTSVPGINHFNILRTIEDSQGAGYAGLSANAAPIQDAFVTPAPEPSTTAGFGMGVALLAGIVARRRSRKTA